jgi:hypothetical protein
VRLAGAGQVLERVNGKSVSAIMKDKGWADIHYIRDMLLEACPLTLSSCGQDFKGSATVCQRRVSSSSY